MAILVGFTATLLLGGWLTLQDTMAVGAYSVLVFMTQRLLWPLTRLGETFDLYQRAMASTTRVLDLLETPISIKDGEYELSSNTAYSSDIEINDLNFSYPNRETLFSNLNLTISANKILGVVGPTGSGKTTLVRLLLRFASPSTGEIIWGGKKINELTLDSLRSNISLVSQHVILFPTTIEENIRYGRPSATVEEVREAAKIAEAIEFIESLPNSWSTLVGEGGHRLSGGQRQRVAIARAVLKNAPLLVLDEATSAVDNETEAALQRSIRRISKDRSTLIIAHRLSTVRNADSIVVLDNGEIVESGTHNELVALNGMYSRLWNVQTGETPE